jgi:hypothetical protein
LGLSQKEIAGKAAVQQPFLPTGQWIAKAAEDAVNHTVGEVYRRIWRGAFPALWQHPDMSK